MKRRRPAHRQRFTPQQRAQLLEAFDRSGLSAAEFAAQNGIGASTLFAWRRRFPVPTKKPLSSPDKNLFKEVCLAEFLGNGAESWAGEVQWANGTHLRWRHQASAAQLQLVLEHFCRPC